MDDLVDAMGAQRIDDRQRPQHIAGNERHLGDINNLADRLYLRCWVHQYGFIAALDENTGDL